MSGRSVASPVVATTRRNGHGEGGSQTAMRNLNLRRAMLTYQMPQRVTARSATEIAPLSVPNRSNSTARSQNDTLKLSLMTRYGSGMGSKQRTRSANNIPALMPSKDDRDKEDVMEEIMRLKRQMRTITNENSVLKTKIRKMESDLNKKHKELEDLLGQTNSVADSISTGKRFQQRLLMQSLKKKIVRLEQTVREKETALNSLKSDLKTTRLEELRVQSETLYQEVLRQRHLNAQEPQANEQDLELRNRLKSMQDTIIRLNNSNRELQEVNRSLRERVNEGHKDDTGTREIEGAERIADDLASMNKPRLIAIIRRLQKELTIQGNGNCGYGGSQTMHEAEQDKSNVDITPVMDSLNGIELGSEALSRDIECRQNGTTPAAGTISSVSTREPPTQPPRPKPRRNRQPGPSDYSDEKYPKNHSSAEEFQRNKAATVIQRHWRRYEDEREEALNIIQSAIRGHANRMQTLENVSQCPEVSSGDQAGPSNFIGSKFGEEEGTNDGEEKGEPYESGTDNSRSGQSTSGEQVHVNKRNQGSTSLRIDHKTGSDTENSEDDLDDSSGSYLQSTSIAPGRISTNPNQAKKIGSQRNDHTIFRRGSHDEFFG